MITHLTAREWAEVLAIAVGIFMAGGGLVWAMHWVDAWDELNAGPDEWKGWEGTRADDKEIANGAGSKGGNNGVV